jgi:hypothetical protein
LRGRGRKEEGEREEGGGERESESERRVQAKAEWEGGLYGEREGTDYVQDSGDGYKQIRKIVQRKSKRTYHQISLYLSISLPPGRRSLPTNLPSGPRPHRRGNVVGGGGGKGGEADLLPEHDVHVQGVQGLGDCADIMPCQQREEEKEGRGKD